MTRLSLDETATCACGAVAMTVAGPVLSMLACSCRDCRKASGTGHSTVVLVPSEAVTISGEVKGHSRIAASGSEITRSFCPNCGTPLFARTARAPKLILLPAGLFDDPAWFAPTQAIFSRSHLDWDMFDPALPRYDTYRDANGF
ncbi:GFA family protein [Pelagibacterium sp. H642]|uniref:GFA family protein n=1 Tax=Pelagibacterium sp. H642 TaxID=1881069 RepID=UPI0028155F40|nr:GFA family protein [Pelagibacterium sp. H642]WMT90020.1 GFA family protein [Pelagibacterium sp. H642]